MVLKSIITHLAIYNEIIGNRKKETKASKRERQKERQKEEKKKERERERKGERETHVTGFLLLTSK
jgi:hypothetical protein